MTTERVSTLCAAAGSFVAAYHARDRLVAEQRGWSPIIVLHATDSGEGVTLRVEDGKVVTVTDRAGTGDVVITSDAATLRDILLLRRGPNEPYLFGDLIVRGKEEDFLRLDYITSMLCPSV